MTEQLLKTVYPFRTSTYANAIYMFGTLRLTARDGFNGVPTEYYIPVEKYAKSHYTAADIQLALTNGWINQQEYDETIAY